MIVQNWGGRIYPLRLPLVGTSPARGEVKSAPFTGELAFAEQMTEGAYCESPKTVIK